MGGSACSTQKKINPLAIEYFLGERGVEPDRTRWRSEKGRAALSALGREDRKTASAVFEVKKGQISHYGRREKKSA